MMKKLLGEKIVPVLWLLLAAIIIGGSVGAAIAAAQPPPVPPSPTCTPNGGPIVRSFYGFPVIEFVPPCAPVPPPPQP
jgi:hypothetical protein